MISNLYREHPNCTLTLLTAFTSEKPLFMCFQSHISRVQIKGAILSNRTLNKFHKTSFFLIISIIYFN